MPKDKREFPNARHLASAIITGVFDKQGKGFGAYFELEKEAAQWIEDYASKKEKKK